MKKHEEKTYLSECGTYDSRKGSMNQPLEFTQNRI
jgi:hypothetical protein